MTGLLVALGAAVGAPLRFWVAHHLDDDLPAGTLLVNLVGSFLLGAFSGLSLDATWWALLGTGFCGAFTTYSAFALQVAERVRGEDSRPLGVAYATFTVFWAVVLCALGFVLTA